MMMVMMVVMKMIRKREGKTRSLSVCDDDVMPLLRFEIRPLKDNRNHLVNSAFKQHHRFDNRDVDVICSLLTPNITNINGSKGRVVPKLVCCCFITMEMCRLLQGNIQPEGDGVASEGRPQPLSK
jgi:hypothetical protein